MEQIYEPAEFLDLPMEIQQHIGLTLDRESLLNLCAVSKGIKGTICEDDVFWKRKYAIDFPEEGTWKEKYQQRAQCALVAWVRAYSDDPGIYHFKTWLKRPESEAILSVRMRISDVETVMKELERGAGTNFDTLGDPYEMQGVRIKFFAETVSIAPSNLFGDMAMDLRRDLFLRILREVVRLYEHQLQDEGRRDLYDNGTSHFVPERIRIV